MVLCHICSAVEQNSLEGTLPTELGRMTAMEYL